jgi:hypothetical protein
MEAMSVVLEGDEGAGGQAVLQCHVSGVGKQAKEAEHAVPHELLEEPFFITARPPTEGQKRLEAYVTRLFRRWLRGE